MFSVQKVHFVSRVAFYISELEESNIRIGLIDN